MSLETYVVEEEVSRLSENDLYNRYLGGDRGTFSEIVKRFQVRGIKFARRFVSQEDAEDVVSHAFFKLSQLKNFDETQKFSTLFLGIIRNKCIDILRKQVTRPTRRFSELSVEEENEFNPRDPATQDAEMNETNEEVEAILQGMSSKHRLVLQMIIEDPEITSAQIAQILHVPEGTAKTRIYHARKNFREEWDRLHLPA